MNIYFHFRKCLQDCFSDFTVDLHRVRRIALLCSSCINFKCHVLLFVSFIYISYNIFSQLCQFSHRYTDYRTDSDNTEYLLKAFYCLIKIIISITIHVDSSVTFVYKEFSVYALQSITNLTYQCIFKDITVLSLNSDLAVFYQK